VVRRLRARGEDLRSSGRCILGIDCAFMLVRWLVGQAAEWCFSGDNRGSGGRM
jgi:hypothetical protein